MIEVAFEIARIVVDMPCAARYLLALSLYQMDNRALPVLFGRLQCLGAEECGI